MILVSELLIVAPGAMMKDAPLVANGTATVCGFNVSNNLSVEEGTTALTLVNFTRCMRGEEDETSWYANAYVCAPPGPLKPK